MCDEVPDYGDYVTVSYRYRHPSNNPLREWEEKEVDEPGVVTAVPSKKFDREEGDYDFDYRLRSDAHPPYDGYEPVRSVDVDERIVAQLHYDDGDERDWDSATLALVQIYDE